MSLFTKLLELKEIQLLSDVEIEFARTLKRVDPTITDSTLLAAVICCYYQLSGNVCVYLERLEKDARIQDLLELLSGGKLDISSLKEDLRKSKMVGSPGEFKPLILEENRLYIQKYWKFENELVQWINERASRNASELSAEARDFIEQQFEPLEDGETDWQKVAVYLSLIKDFLIISGGPGTGKTFTVSKIIESLQKFNTTGTRIALAAPTGKAAQRLTDTLSVSTELELTAQTLHRLLGARIDGTFVYGKNKKLPYDIVIVDEASMLDLRLWIQLVRSLGKQTKLIVLGDKDQLSSVEAGAVLGDICEGAKNEFTPSLSEVLAKNNIQFNQQAADTTALNDCIVLLTKSYRFGEDSGLKLLSEAINTSDVEGALRILKDENIKDVHWIEPNAQTVSEVIEKYCVATYTKSVGLNSVEKFEAYREAQILCAIKRGPFGVEHVNHETEERIKEKSGLPRNREWFEGRFILFTRNDRGLKVQNGETGIYFSDKDSAKILVEGNVDRQISAGRVQDFQPAYAITVHKSQGSEYKNVALILPNEQNAILSKEFLYTGVTRTRRNALIVATKEILEFTIRQKISRNSGLAEKLWIKK